MKRLMFQKELTLINQISQKNAWFVINGILKILVRNLNHMFVINVIVYQIMAYDLENIVILNVKNVDYRCVLWNMTRNDAINRLNNSKLDDQGTLWIWILVQIKYMLK